MDQIVSVFFVLALILWRLDNSRSSGSRFKKCSTCHLVKRISQEGSECQQCMQWKSNNPSGLESVKQVCHYCKSSFAPVRGESMCDRCETRLANQHVGQKKEKDVTGGLCKAIFDGLAGLIEGKPKTSSPLVGSYRCGGCATLRTKSTKGKRCPVCVSKGIPSTSDKSINQNRSVEDDKYFKCSGCGFLRLASVRAERCPTCVRGEMSSSEYQGVTPQNINAQKTKKYTDDEIKFIFSSISDEGNNYQLISNDEIDSSLSIINLPEWKKMLRPIIEKLPANMFYFQFEGQIYDDDRPVIEEFFRLWKQVSEGLLNVAELELMVSSFPEFRETRLDEIVAFIEYFRTTHTNVITPTLLNLEKFRNLFKGYCKSEGQLYGSKEDTESRCDVWWDKRVAGKSNQKEKVNSFESSEIEKNQVVASEQLFESESSINKNEVQPPQVPNSHLKISSKDWDRSQIPDEVLDSLTPWDPMSYRNLWEIEERDEIEIDELGFNVKGPMWLELMKNISQVGREINSDPYYLHTLNSCLGLKCESIHFEINQTHRIDHIDASGGDPFPAFGISADAVEHLGILGPQEIREQGSIRWSLGALIGSQPFLVPVIIVATRKDGVDKIAVVVLFNVCFFPEVAEIFACLFKMRLSGSPEVPGFEEGLVAVSRLGLIAHGSESGLDLRFREHLVQMRYWMTISNGVFLRAIPTHVLPKERDVRLFCPQTPNSGLSIFSSEVVTHSGFVDCWY